MPLLQSSFPNLHSLRVLNMLYECLDMSRNETILSLDLTCDMFLTRTQWLHLPPQLQHLSIRGGIHHVPPKHADGTSCVKHLLSLKLDTTYENLDVFAQLLRAAPLLRTFENHRDHVELSFFFDRTSCDSTVADLATLHAHRDFGIFRGTALDIYFSKEDVGPEIMHALASLPVMTVVTKCTVRSTTAAECQHLLCAFPDVSSLILIWQDCDDLELQALAACSSLTRLLLIGCNNVHTVGLIALIPQLPRLAKIRCLGCKWLSKDVVEGCLQLLERHGRHVEMGEWEDP